MQSDKRLSRARSYKSYACSWVGKRPKTTKRLKRYWKHVERQIAKNSLEI